MITVKKNNRGHAVAYFCATVFASAVAAMLRVLEPHVAGLLRGVTIDRLMTHTITVNHFGAKLQFCSPNIVATIRSLTFSSKEPDTLHWIESFAAGTVFWDIGANVGLYSVYAAKRVPLSKVYAFEPSVLNLELLARNIALNGVAAAVTIVPIALFSKTTVGEFTLSNLDRAGSLSAFGVNFGGNGKTIQVQMQYRMLGLSADDAVELLAVPAPHYIKLDVDGVEHLILAGAASVLRNQNLASIMVETSNSFSNQRLKVAEALVDAGFSQISTTETNYGRTSNTIWSRNKELNP